MPTLISENEIIVNMNKTERDTYAKIIEAIASTNDGIVSGRAAIARYRKEAQRMRTRVRNRLKKALFCFRCKTDTRTLRVCDNVSCHYKRLRR
jgi:hypothetical protein